MDFAVLLRGDSSGSRGFSNDKIAMDSIAVAEGGEQGCCDGGGGGAERERVDLQFEGCGGSGAVVVGSGFSGVVDLVSRGSGVLGVVGFVAVISCVDIDVGVGLGANVIVVLMCL